MSIELNAIYNGNLYLNGHTQIGRAGEVKLSEIEIEQDEYKGLGLAIGISLPMGIKIGETEITWNSFYADAFRSAYDPYAANQLMIRSSVQVHNTMGRKEEQPLVAVLTGLFSKSPLGTFKPKERAEFSSTFIPTSGSIKLNGREVLFFDAFTNVYRVSGADMLDKYRRNIGA